jgi:hypothetical protein
VLPSSRTEHSDDFLICLLPACFHFESQQQCYSRDLTWAAKRQESYHGVLVWYCRLSVIYVGVARLLAYALSNAVLTWANR